MAGASPTAKDRLAAGEQLIPGQRLVSPDGRFGLTFEASGNLVLTEYASGTVRWQSGTAGKPAARLALGSEGNLVLRRCTAGGPCRATVSGRGLRGVAL